MTQRVMIKCPATGQVVPTGMVMTPQSFASSVLTNNSIQCAACGKMHVWNKADAFLEALLPH